MRDVRQDIAGNTDANGSATIPIKLAATGEWRNIKVAASTTGPAEWALSTSGSTVTYGRGRRVTLGPELVRDGEVLTVTVTGGPASAPILGTVSGTAGAPAEILPTFAPQPNTIALDSLAPHQALKPVTVTTKLATPSFAVASGGLSGAQIFTIPPGTIAMRVMVTAGGLLFTYNLLVLGRESNVQYFGQTGSPDTAATVPTPTLPITIPIENDWDQHVEIHVELPTQNVNVFVSALFDVEAPGQAGASQSVFEPTPAPWQVADGFLGFKAVFVAGVDQTLVAGLPNQRIRMFSMIVNHNGNVSYEGSIWDGPSANNINRGHFIIGAAPTSSVLVASGGGLMTAPGNDLVYRVEAEQVGATTYMTLAKSQG